MPARFRLIAFNTFAACFFGVWLAVQAGESRFGFALAEVLLALVLVRAFCLVHELSHGTLFPARWINDLVGVFASLLCALPYYPWKKVHIEHHLWAGVRERDPTEADQNLEEVGAFGWFAANWAWRLWIPALGFAFSLKTFWNLPNLARWFPSRKDRNLFLLSIAVIPLVHGSMFLLFGGTYLKIYFPAFTLFLVIMDPLVLSQHVFDHPSEGCPGGSRPLKSSEQEKLARTVYLPRWFSRYVLLGFNLHSLHHLRPSVAGHLLVDIPFVPTHSMSAWTWIVCAKGIPLEMLLQPEVGHSSGP
jgi:fatty acid desaturase